MSYQLRPYQQECADFVLGELAKKSKSPLLLNLSCGWGKSFWIAEVAKCSGLRTLILTVTKELCEQDYAKLDIVMGGKNIGMYSASWGRKETEYVTVATVQSAARHPELWKDYELIIADEAECFNVDGLFGKLLDDSKRVIGVTGTAYGHQGSRSGRWYTTKIFPLHKIKTKTHGWFWQPVCYNCPEKELIKMGYLCPVKVFSSPIKCSMLKYQSNGSEYTLESVEKWVLEILDRIIEVMLGAEKNEMCHSGIVFMPSVQSCLQLEELCKAKNISARAVHATTPAKERDEIIDAHKSGELKWLINQGIATRGFDAPAVDCLVFARPSSSLRLIRQMQGRVLRTSPGKTVGYIFDLTENCKRWGNPEDVVMGKNGWQDTILLRGKDISGMETSRINLANRYKKQPKVYVPPADGTEVIKRGRKI